MVETTESTPESELDLAQKRLVKVLHVDDETGFTKAAKLIIEEQGNFEMDVATSVNNALEKMKQCSYTNYQNHAN